MTDKDIKIINGADILNLTSKQALTAIDSALEKAEHEETYIFQGNDIP